MEFKKALEQAQKERAGIEPELQQILCGGSDTDRAFAIMELNPEPPFQFVPMKLSAAEQLTIDRQIDCDIICSKVFGESSISDLEFERLKEENSELFKKKSGFLADLPELIKAAIATVMNEAAQRELALSQKTNSRPGLPIEAMAKSMRAARVERDVENGVAYISEYGENNGPLIRTRIESA